jgi:hypothetical protein
MTEYGVCGLVSSVMAVMLKYESIRPPPGLRALTSPLLRYRHEPRIVLSQKLNAISYRFLGLVGGITPNVIESEFNVALQMFVIKGPDDYRYSTAQPAYRTGSSGPLPIMKGKSRRAACPDVPFWRYDCRQAMEGRL